MWPGRLLSPAFSSTSASSAALLGAPEVARGFSRAAVRGGFRSAEASRYVPLFSRIAVSRKSHGYTYDELKGKTIAELREIAKSVENHDAVQGYSQMNKDHLLPALCKALGLEAHIHHAASGIDKAAIKAKMRALKDQRNAALQSHDP